MKMKLVAGRQICALALAFALTAGAGGACTSASEDVLVGTAMQQGTVQGTQASEEVSAQTEAASQSLQTDNLAGFGTTETTPASSEEEWCLILVNRTHPIPDDYEIPSLTRLSGGHQVDSRIYPALQQMFDDARAQGIYPAITSSYRTMEDQQAQMDEKIAEYQASGYSAEEAKKLAEEWVAIPGTSEHQLGLCVDISADVASGQDPGTVWYWLLENSWQYGFVKRYPEDKTDITGIINEPWHFRYVGVNAATQMTQQGLCLEEYLGQM